MVSLKAYTLGALAILLGVLAAGVLIGPAVSQGTISGTNPESTAADETIGNQSDIEPPVDADDTELSLQYVQSLNMALGSCFKDSPAVAPETVVTLGFAIDETGHLVGLPEYLDTSTATTDARRLFLNSAVSLDDCAPFPSDGSGAQFEMVISTHGVQSLKRMSGPSARQSPSLRSAAAAVHQRADKESEDDLSLTRAQRSEIQLRLQVLGFDPKGVDGVFGQASRNAISAWQVDKGFPDTGFLNAVQLLALNAQSQADYADYIAKNPPQKKTRKRVRICKPIGVLGLQKCHYEYRWD